jgi:hypothetical protein
MSVVLTTLVAVATSLFGAVYPWVYLPMFTAAAGIGLVGLTRGRGIPAESRAVAFAALAVVAAILLQLVPLPAGVLSMVSPHTPELLSRYDLTFALQPRHALSINVSRTALSLGAFASLALYFTGLPALVSRRTLRAFPGQLLVFAVPLALVSIYFRERNNGLVFGFWQPETGSGSNSFGPFVNRNHFAGWMLMATCLAMGALVGRIESAVREAKPGARNWVAWLATPGASHLILMGIGTIVTAVSLVWTLSRSGIISFACAIVCFAWLMTRRHTAGRARGLVIVIVLGTVGLTSLGLRGTNLLGAWFADTRDMVSRLDAWHDGWQVVTTFPVAGTGMGTYPDAMLFYQSRLPELWMTHAHNDYLQLAAEGGVLVSVPVLVSLGFLGLSIGRSLRAASHESNGYWVRAGAAVGLAALAVQETVEFSLHIPADALLFATLAAIAVSRTPGPQPSARTH